MPNSATFTLVVSPRHCSLLIKVSVLVKILLMKAILRDKVTKITSNSRESEYEIQC